MKTQAGFTLIELVIVLVIIGLLAAVAGPKFLDMQTTAKTNVSTNIVGSINSAMSVAFASHRATNVASGGGSSAGVDQYITDCASAQAYMEGGNWPTSTSCTGTSVTTPDGVPHAITAETDTSRAVLAP